ncbi:hypothetical protein [Dysgonomonas sp. Marseille-P4361]|uniref:hypothetical protein n=1 Tax=Dysgonomonas sp. Marseille-P4361 TaxID=2161820 RepID=UPI000D5502B7|nr:hypothetical protein [Dysgonomonas sp. Marseille-P4361]
MKAYHYPLYILAAITSFLFYSCDNDEPDTPETQIVDKLSLQSWKQDLNVLEPTSIWPDMQHSIFKLFDRFDSVRWGVPDLNEELYIAGQQSLTGNMDISFLKPGIYSAIISGYKEGKIAEADTLKFKCYIDGDFLSLKWENNDKPGNYSVGGYNNVVRNFQLSLTHVKGEKPYAHLEYTVGSFPISDPNADELKQRAESREFLSEYITDLYGNPVYNYKNEDFANSPLLEEYHKRFVIALDGLGLGITYMPIAIWDTDKSHITLLGAVDNEKKESYHYYTVIAEPRKL